MADSTTAATASRETARHRNVKVGEVVSRSGNKTIVVEVTRRVQHPLYKRFVNKTKRFYAHDEQNQSQLGDRVRIMETRPLSRLKRWRLVQIVHRRALAVPQVKEPEAAATAPPAAFQAQQEGQS